MEPSLAERIKVAREDQGLSQRQLAQALGFSQAAVNHWESGRSEPNLETIKRIAKITGKPEHHFLDLPQPDTEKVRQEVMQAVRRDVAGFVGVKMLPVVGRIAAGTPLMADENIDEWLPVPKEFGDQADFLLRVRGDSMADAGIHGGDYVLVRHTDTARPGDIVVALVNGDLATLKFLRYRDNRYYLEAANPGYDSIPVNEEVHVQGVYVGLFTRRGLAAATTAPEVEHQPPPLSADFLITSLAAHEELDPDQIRLALQLLKAGKKGR